MGCESNLIPMEEFPLILTMGGDDRLTLNPKTGANKYHGKPVVNSEAAFRGSCTCNSPTPLAYEAAQEAYTELLSGDLTCEQYMQNTRD